MNPRVQISYSVNLKGLPKGYVGPTGHTAVIGKGEPVNFKDAMMLILNDVADYYGMCYDAKDLNEQVESLSVAISKMRFEEVEK